MPALRDRNALHHTSHTRVVHNKYITHHTYITLHTTRTLRYTLHYIPRYITNYAYITLKIHHTLYIHYTLQTTPHNTLHATLYYYDTHYII